MSKVINPPVRPTTPGENVRAFRQRHKIDQPTVDRLLGFSSEGRATRRWEAEGAPYYVTILMAYADKYGLELMEELARGLDGTPPAA